MCRSRIRSRVLRRARRVCVRHDMRCYRSSRHRQAYRVLLEKLKEDYMSDMRKEIVSRARAALCRYRIAVRLSRWVKGDSSRMCNLHMEAPPLLRPRAAIGSGCILNSDQHAINGFCAAGYTNSCAVCESASEMCDFVSAALPSAAMLSACSHDLTGPTT